MITFLAYTFTGLFTGAAYAIAASGLVLTYTTTRVFNLGHGAISMVCAFLYWQLTVQEHMNGFLALMLILVVIAPAMGFVIERVLARNLGDAPVSVSLVVTVGLFVGLVGIAQQVWPATVSRSINQWFPGDGITIGSYNLSYHQLITILISIAVAGGLYVLLNRTRTGTAMRAAVDNRDLLALFGGSPRRVSTFSWALGSSLAALAGILLVSTVGLDYYELTFLVINAFAAAMFGRLQSLPLTFVGAMALGLAQAYVFYLPSWSTLDGIRQTLPTIMLFIVLIFVPQVRLRVGQIKGILAAPVPTIRRSLQYGGGLVVVVLLAVQVLSDTNQLRLGSALTYAMVMLSLVLLTGYGGYVSMAQLTFMGIGAAVVAKLNTTSPMAIVAAVLIAAAVGALVALPVLRLTGLYLALATFAFAQLMDKLVFQTNFMFGFNGNLNAKPMSLFGYSFNTTASYNVLCAVAFVLVGRRCACGSTGSDRACAHRDARQPGGLRHARPQPALVPGRPVRCVRRNRRPGRRIAGRRPRHRRRCELPSVQWPAPTSARGRERRYLGDRRVRRRHAADVVARAAVAVPDPRRARVPDHRDRRRHPRTQPERAGQPRVYRRPLGARSLADPVHGAASPPHRRRRKRGYELRHQRLHRHPRARAGDPPWRCLRSSA